MHTRIVLILVAAAALAGCGGSAGSAGDDRRMDVVAAFYPLAYAAERVGGRAVSVTNLTPPGVEPHDVELSAAVVERVRDADVVLFLGSGFQPALEDAVGGARGERVDLLEGLDLLGGDELDPHVWLDPLRYAAIVERMGDVLGRPQPAAAVGEELRELDGELRLGLADCERREIVTSHAAFGYLAERYGLIQVALTGLSPEAEPSPRALERLVDEVRRSGATTVFHEPLLSPRLAETVARESGATTAVLNPLEGLAEAELARGEDYFSVMRANLAALGEALGCR